MTTKRPCPVCGKPSDVKSAPFCSPRCADVDLNRWLSGAYVVNSVPDEDEEMPGQVFLAGDANEHGA